MKHVNRIACLTLLAFISTSLYGEEKKTSQAEAGGARVFNVLNYGAVGDDKTDNTDAFSACLKDVIAAGGGCEQRTDSNGSTRRSSDAHVSPRSSPTRPRS